MDSNISSNINIKDNQIEINGYGLIIISDIQNSLKELENILEFKKIL
jgi:hypothetical protein